MPHWSRGFTLVEVLVALVVLGVGVLGAIGGLVHAERELWRAEMRSQAAGVLLNRMAELRAVAARTNPRCLDLASGTSGAAPGPLESWVVTTDGSGRRVRVQVRFTGRRAVADSVDLVIRCG